MWGGFLIPRLSKGMLHFGNDHGQYLIIDVYFPIKCAFWFNKIFAMFFVKYVSLEVEPYQFICLL